jgi:DNA/RNA non-specific endonuclease
LNGGKEAKKTIFPPGLPPLDENDRSTNPKPGANYIYDRCHIIGRQLGGNGHNPDNLFTCFHEINTPMMRGIETEVKRAVRARQQVDYRVTLIYRRRSGPMSSAIRITAHGVGPGGTPGINVDKCLENKLGGRVLSGNAC